MRQSRKTVRIDPNLLARFSDEMKRRNLESANDLINDALQHYFQCKTLDPTGSMKLILLQWDAQCLQHKGETIKAGKWAYYGRGIGAICLDAIIEKQGDKATVRKYLKNRQLERTHRFLKKECDRLADRLETFQIGDKALLALQQVGEEHDLAMRYFKEGVGMDNEKKFLEELMRSNDKTKRVIRDVEDYLTKMLRLKKWKKREKDVETEHYQQ